MAVGRQDYQAGVVPVKSGYSLVQVPIYYSNQITVGATADVTTTIWTVGAGFIQNVYGLRVSCVAPFADEVQFIVAATIKYRSFFSGQLVENFPYENEFKATATQVVQVKIFNNDSIEKVYDLTLFSQLEQVES